MRALLCFPLGFAIRPVHHRAMQRRVLVVEDEPSIAETILYALRTELFEAVHHETGNDAL